MRRMSEPDPPDPLQDGPTLNADGQLEGRLARIEAAGAAPLPVPAQQPPLELAERAPKRPEAPVEGYRAPIPARRRSLAVRIVLAAAIAGAVLLGGGLLFSKPGGAGKPAETVHENGLLDRLVAGGPRPPAIVSSEPAGATVRIGGTVVGVTPWAGDNVWAGETPVVVELPGYKPWRGTLRGGEEVNLNARLTK
jgi:serine/threonine-protein kinase